MPRREQQRRQRLGVVERRADSGLAGRLVGDGSEKLLVKSDGNVEQHAKDGYAVTQHRFAKPGHYLVRVERTNERGQKGTGHLHVTVGAGDASVPSK